MSTEKTSTGLGKKGLGKTTSTILRVRVSKDMMSDIATKAEEIGISHADYVRAIITGSDIRLVT